jgi:hypothetical protein
MTANIPSREEVVKFLKNQLSVYYDEKPGPCFHYGYWELRKLLDFIYSGPPTKPSEELNK